MSYQDGATIEKSGAVASDEYDGYQPDAPIHEHHHSTTSSIIATPDIYTAYPHHVNLSPGTYKGYILDSPPPTQIQWRILADSGFEWFKKWGLGFWGYFTFNLAVMLVIDWILSAIIISALGKGDIPAGKLAYAAATKWGVLLWEKQWWDPNHFWTQFFLGLPFAFLHAAFVMGYTHAIIKRILYDTYPGQTSLGLATSGNLSSAEGSIPHWSDWFYGFKSAVYLEIVKVAIPIAICLGIANSIFWVIIGMYVSFVAGFNFFILYQWGSSASNRFATTSPSLGYAAMLKIAFTKVNQNLMLIITWLFFNLALLLLGLVTIVGWIATIPIMSYCSAQITRSIFGFRQEFAIRSPKAEEEDVEVVGAESIY